MCPLTVPPALTVNIMKNIESSSIVVQWDKVDNSLPTNYIVTWTSERDHITHPVTLIEQSSYTITGLILDTVYTIAVTANNRCGQGPEYRTSVILTADTMPTMSPKVTTSIPPTTFMSSINYGTTTAVVSISAATTTTAVINLSTTSTATATTTVIVTSYVTPTSTAYANPANVTTADKACKL